MQQVESASIPATKFYEDRFRVDIAANYKREIDKLKAFVKKLTAQEREEFAIAVGTTYNHMTQIYYGNRPCPIDYAVNIDRLTNGEVSMVSLVPDVDWKYIKKVVSKRS